MLHSEQTLLEILIEIMFKKDTFLYSKLLYSNVSSNVSPLFLCNPKLSLSSYKTTTDITSNSNKEKAFI